MLALGIRAGALACKRAIDHRVNLTPVADRLFVGDFKLDEWLDQQGVPPPVLGVSREGTLAVRQAASTSSARPATAAAPVADGEAFLVLAEIFEQARQSIPDAAKTRLSQTRVVTVGRQAGVSLLIDHDSVSRRHAEISYNDQRYILRDTGSSNGTFIDTTRLPAGTASVLQPGEHVRFGKITYVFLREEPSQNAQLQATILNKTRLVEHATGFYDPAALEAPTEAAQPLLKADGSLLLPGAREAIPASEVATFTSTPALVALLQGRPRICYLKPGKTISLGRDKQNELALPDMSVSRKHAEVFYSGDGFYLRDLGSGNGVSINQAKIDNPYRLTHSDCIQIGGTTLFFLQPGAQKDIAPGRSSATFVCQFCGVPRTQDARFCAHCGADFKQPVFSKA
jgi:pSer/pThr/pTyr-binding forkhead associated (FHA) protein